MIIIAGTFEVEPDQREEFLLERREGMRRSRAEAGCLEYVFSADPLDPGRVVLLERWESQDALDAHVAVLRAQPRSQGVVATTTSVRVYDVSGERALRS